jgi:hypothetical protein
MVILGLKMITIDTQFDHNYWVSLFGSLRHHGNLIHCHLDFWLGGGSGVPPDVLGQDSHLAKTDS